MNQITCRARVSCPTFDQAGNMLKAVPISLASATDVSAELSLKWANGIMETAIPSIQNASELLGTDTPLNPRPFDFLLDYDGGVESIGPETQETGTSYPAPFQIPEATLIGLSPEEIKMRAEFFAVGGLLYEVISLKKPFEDLGLDDEEIQDRYTRGEFPDDVWDMPLSSAILSCWSAEFREVFEAEVLKRSQGMFTRLGNYARENPVKFGLQASGGALTLASLATVPVLGVLGFSGIGPVAGSIAAGAQSSMGIVQAGSIFAWCQSVTMGGAAVGGLTAAGLTGAGVATAASLPLMKGENLKEMFQNVVRKVEE